MNAAKSVGGDFYDFFLIDENHLGFTIADVSDKGIPAAIFMAISRTVIRATALRQLSPATVLEQSNELLCKESVNNMFVTVFYAILNIYTGEVSFCNGGHNRPVYIRQDGEVSMLPLTGSMALGVMADAVYQEKTIRLNPGDSFFLYTDGISEAMDKHDNPYGNDRLMDVCRSMKKMSSKEMVEIMTNSVCEFVDGALQSDDMTMLAIVYKDNTAV